MRRLQLALGLAVAVALTACGASQAELEALRNQQEEILARLDKLSDGQQKILASRQAPAARPGAEDFDKVYQIAVGDSPIKGNRDALVTIVEYSDFQCPYCARSGTVLEQVLEKYGDRVRLVYKHFPLNFHPAARPAAIASLAAHEQGRFWEMHDVLFANQRSLDPKKMHDYATQAGLDVDRFGRDMEAKRAEYDKRVSAEYNSGVAAAVRGTPTLYINGKKVRRPTVPGMSQMIDALLKQG